MVNLEPTFRKYMRRFTIDYVEYSSDIYLSLYIQNIVVIATTSALLSGTIKISNLFQLKGSPTSGTIGNWVLSAISEYANRDGH